jgi:enediyne biosynthesis protein E4
VPGNPPHAGNFLYKNNGNRTFTDATTASLRNSGWSWGATFLDQDNDRDLDIFVTNGWDPNLPDQSHVYENSGGAFTDVSNAVGVTDNKLGRGLLSFDYDNDGDLDVFIANHGNPFGGSLSSSILYRNDGGNANDWLKIKVQGTTSNRDGLGTFITVDPDTSVTGDEMVREINAGSNFLSQNELTAHFGLGPNSGNIDLITVVWPSGAMQELTSVSANQVLNLVENAALLGDYNHNLVVDVADYVVWRSQLGSTGAGLAADGDGDQMVTSHDYDVWKENFGNMAVGAAFAAQHAPVPEPSTVLLFVVGTFITAYVSQRGLSRSRWTMKEYWK